MEELIQKITSQYEAEDYSAILDTVTEMRAMYDALSTSLAKAQEEKAEIETAISKVHEENAKLKSANATLFLKVNGADAVDPAPSEESGTEFEAMINPAEFF